MTPAAAQLGYPEAEEEARRGGLLGVALGAMRALARSIRPLAIPVVIADLKRQVRAARSFRETVDIVFDFRWERVGIPLRPWQVRSEIEGVLDMLRERPPRTVLEIGTSVGGSLFLFARAAAPDALLISVDLPHGEFGGGYPRWRAPLYRSFASGDQRVELIRGDSHRQETVDRVRELLRGRPVDFLFIDGDHTYEGVKRDFEMYRSLVAPDGMIGFHDIVPEKASSETFQGGDVPRFWSEVAQDHVVEELVADYDAGSFGIGVVRLGAKP